MYSETFSVDAALLQELGERLIGRAHIALAELIKNAYDADAINCDIQIDGDGITITDDGHGMSEREFLDHWMRIGTTHKVQQEQSRLLRRALTGSKGIGRLSAQYLASEMELWSTSVDQPDQVLYAVVDWRKISRGRNLDAFEVLWETRKDTLSYSDGQRTGTRIVLKRLKAEWDTQALERLGQEIWMLRSPFKVSSRLPGSRTSGDFYVDIDAPGIKDARAAFDTRRSNVFRNWKARITGHLEHGRRGGEASVTVEFKEGYPNGAATATSFGETFALPVGRDRNGKGTLIDRARFEILVFRPSGRQPYEIPVADMREYLSRFGNVSVYDAGFRLPYYGSGGDHTGQDWLNVAVDQGRRLNASELLPERLRISNRYMQDLPAPGRLFGAVEIDTGHETAVAKAIEKSPNEWLQIQSSRDRLQANSAFFQLRDFVRFSLDFYANRYRMLSLRAAEETRVRKPASRAFERALNVLNKGREEMPAAVYRGVKREVAEVRKSVAAEESALDQRAALLAPLASAGMIALALTHELVREIRILERSGQRIRRIAKTHTVPELDAIAQEFDGLRGRLEAVQELFSPLLSEEDTESTERLRVRPLVQQVVRSMGPLVPRVEFDLSGIAGSLRFPLGSFADWNAILQNVIANAWNAMLDRERAAISFAGDRSPGGREWLRVSDTGQGLGVPLDESRKIFEPFERRLKISHDNRSIALGGQGLGLTIVRMIAHRRTSSVRFVKPPDGFSTTFELSWRGAPV